LKKRTDRQLADALMKALAARLVACKGYAKAIRSAERAGLSIQHQKYNSSLGMYESLKVYRRIEKEIVLS
jgi:hypothetical protein